MKKIYKSKVEIVIAIPVAIALVVIETLMILNRVWPLAILILVITAFLLYLYAGTIYEFTGDEKLRIRSGFLYDREIYIQSIKRIRETRNHMASPALSADRLEILFNRYDRVLISPDEKKQFISALKDVNPRIMVET